MVCSGSGLRLPAMAATLVFAVGCADAIAPTQTASSITLSDTTLAFAALGDTATLSATAVDAGGHEVSGLALTWASSDTMVAQVSAGGLVDAIGNGTATVTVWSGAVKAAAAVTVQQVATGVVPATDTLRLVALGDTATLGVVVIDANGHAIVGTRTTWTSSKPAIAQVSPAGLVTAIGNGVASVTARSGTVSAIASVIVRQTAASIELTLGQSALYRGATTPISAVAFDARGNGLTDRAPVVGSSDLSVVGLASGGTSAVALSDGSAIVEATIDSVRAERQVDVLPIADLIGFAPDTVAVIFRSYIITPRAILSNGDSVDVPVAALASSDTTVLVMTTTGVRARQEGVAEIGVTVAGVTRSQRVRVVAYEDRPIPAALAAVDSRAINRIPVIEVRALPTRDGIRLDSLASPDFWTIGGASLAEMQQRIDSLLIKAKYALEEGSRFRGYDSASEPSITLEVRRIVTYYRVPPAASQYVLSDGTPSYFVDFAALFDELGVVADIDREQATQVWFTYGSWGGGTPSVRDNPPGFDPTTARTVSESAMASPSGACVSNSWYADCQNLPRADHTYVLYGYNPFRGWSCAVHNHGHQFEREFGFFDFDNFFWPRFATFGRAGHTHSPPNTRDAYDYRNPRLVASDIKDWEPAGGDTTLVNVDTWEGVGYRYPDFDNCGGVWLIYWMQSFPGRDNAIALDGSRLENWWDIYADFDRWLAERRSLVSGHLRPAAASRGAAGGPVRDVDPQVLPPSTDYPPPSRRRR